MIRMRTVLPAKPLLLISLTVGLCLLSTSNTPLLVAKNGNGNITNSNLTEGLIVSGGSFSQPLSIVSCLVTKYQVPTPGIRFNVLNDSGKARGWWNIPSSGIGNNVGGDISEAIVNQHSFKVAGTINYDYLCSEKNDLNYKISITGNCGENTTIRYESSNELASHDFRGNATCS